MFRSRSREKKIELILSGMAKHKNAEHLQKLIILFDCDCEHLRSWEYYSADEMVKIIEENKPIKKINMSSRREKTKKSTKENDVFVPGIAVFEPHKNAPDFVVASIILNRDTLIEWLDDEENDKYFKGDKKYGDSLNLQLNESKDGNLYLAINTYGTDADESDNEPEDKSSRRSRGSKK